MENIFLSPIGLDQLAETFYQAAKRALNESQPTLEANNREADLLTAEQAAELLNLKKQTVYLLSSKNLIPVMRRRKRLYFSREELLTWIAEGRRKTIAEIEADASAFLKRSR